MKENLQNNPLLREIENASVTSVIGHIKATSCQMNFLNVINSTRVKIPFGIAQIGKAFRNEIIARQFIFRMREFEQMEMQFFVEPGSEMEWYENWKEKYKAVQSKNFRHQQLPGNS